MAVRLHGMMRVLEAQMYRQCATRGFDALSLFYRIGGIKGRLCSRHGVMFIYKVKYNKCNLNNMLQCLINDGAVSVQGGC